MKDEEIYHKIEFLHFDENDFTGCYFKGHIELDQWKRIASDFLKTECDIEVSEIYTSFKKGWYKVLPDGHLKLFINKVRGSYPVMECIHD